MNEGTARKMTREERLAAKLRENLRRRKVQARAQDSTACESLTDMPTESLPKSADES